MDRVSEPAPPDGRPVYGPDDVERRAVPRPREPARLRRGLAEMDAWTRLCAEPYYDEGTRLAPR